MFVSMGTYRFDANKPAQVTISTDGTDGDVCADAVQFIKIDLNAAANLRSPGP